MPKKIFITTPLYYVNGAPHLGHAYTTILADVLARYQRINGDDVFFLTGLDEHGQKVKQAAEKRNLSIQEHCDELAVRFLELWKKLNILNDDFIRTTESLPGCSPRPQRPATCATNPNVRSDARKSGRCSAVSALITPTTRTLG